MKGIYRIKNKINNKYYIGSSSDIIGRIKNHKSNLKNNKHGNKKLQSSYNKYGKDCFEYSIVEMMDDSVTDKELLKIEQSYLDNLVKSEVFNLSFLAGSGGAEVLRIPCYILDLKGNIIKECESVSDAYKKFLKMSNSSCVNSGAIHKSLYRVVTQEFYNTNLYTILFWKSFSKVIPIPKEPKPVMEIYLYMDGEFIICNSCKEVSDLIKISKERVRQILKENKLNSYFISLSKERSEEMLNEIIKNRQDKRNKRFKVSEYVSQQVSLYRFTEGNIFPSCGA